MSDLPGEITKQILRAPPRIIRSTKCSLTAQGRSTPSRRRLPTGSSSFEKARGWMRLPRPAAGTIPHMSGALRGFGTIAFGERALEIVEAPLRGVVRQGAGPARRGDAADLGLAAVEGRQHVGPVAGDQDLLAG